MASLRLIKSENASFVIVALLSGLFVSHIVSMIVYERVKEENQVNLAAASTGQQGLGKNAMVVGGTSGIGRGIALRLAQAKMNVFIVGRNRQAAEEILAEMKAVSPEQKHEFLECDASLIKNIASLSNDFVQRNITLDYLVLTQGKANLRSYGPTPEGIDRKLAIYYFGRVAFMKKLVPSMKGSPDPRVLSVLSGGIHSAYKQYNVDPHLKDNYAMKKVADASGFYNDIGLDSMSRENPDVSFIHAAPGIVSTNWGNEMPWYVSSLVNVFFALFGRSPSDCAEYMVHTLFDPAMKGGFHVADQYGREGKVVDLHEEARPFVWEFTNKLISPYLK